MKKFILVVPTSDGEKFSISNYYINKLKKLDIFYYICDYNVENICFENICGILLTGGGDINPVLYGEKINDKTNNVDNKRDMFETFLLKEAFNRKIATLGICRGIQIMNVAFGGTINQHIEGHMQKQHKSTVTHSVEIDKSSTFYNIVHKENIMVNSLHHQVIEKLADGFSVFGKSGNVIEGIECTDKDKTFFALQWHPEALEDENSNKIFEYFINKAKENL